MQNVADLKDPTDGLGRTYREVNNATKHKLPLGSLVELYTGARLLVTRRTRDCDGTPLYSLGSRVGNTLCRGYSEGDLTLVEDL